MTEENRICAVLLSPYDGAPRGKAVFCRLLRAWFSGTKRQSGREKAVEDGKEIVYSYRLTKRDLRWEKRCGSLMLEGGRSGRVRLEHRGRATSRGRSCRKHA